MVDFLKEYYNVDNGNNLQPLNEETLSRIINKHGKDGFVIVSANRTDKTAQQNNINNKAIIQDIKKSMFAYCPVYGGYHGKDGVIDSFEPSYIIFNYNKYGELQNFSDLKLFAILLCDKYGQDSVLIKEPNKPPYYPNKPPYYVNKEGDIIGKAVDNNIDVNNPKNEYYTSLIKSNNLDYNTPNRLKRFSYNINFECYGHPNPNTLNELRRRSEGFGEVILKFGDKNLI